MINLKIEIARKINQQNKFFSNPDRTNFKLKKIKDKYSRPLSADTFDKYIENFSMTEFWENDGILFPNYNN